MTGSELERPTPTAPATLPEQMSYAKALATAQLLPKAYRDRPGDVLLALEYGRSLGISPTQVFTGVHVIDGKPSMSAELMAALVRRAGHRLRTRGDTTTATCEITRRDDPDFVYAVTFTLEDAQRADLLKIQPDGTVRSRGASGKATGWEKYPAAMLLARAVSACARQACPDVLAGVSYVPEELGRTFTEEPDQLDTQAPARVEPTPAAAPAAVAVPDPVVVDLAEPAAPTIADDLAENWANRWHLDLEQAITALDLPAVQELATAAAAAGYPDLIQDARTAWGTVQQRLVDNDRVRRRQPADPAVDLQDADPDADARQQLLDDDQVAGQLTIDEDPEG